MTTEIKTVEEYQKLMMELPYTIGEDLDDRAERMGSTHGHDIASTGGVET